MIYSTNKFSTSLKAVVAVAFTAALACAPLALADEHKESSDASETKSVTGEVVDMMCYVDHKAMGEEHAAKCGKTCIKRDGPVGIVSDGKAYLVVGDHKPMNDQLAEYAGKTITVKGKMASNGGIHMIENAEIVKK